MDDEEASGASSSATGQALETPSAHTRLNEKQQSTRLATWVHTLYKNIGLTTIYNAPIHAKIILAQLFIRVFAFGIRACSSFEDGLLLQHAACMALDVRAERR